MRQNYWVFVEGGANNAACQPLGEKLCAEAWEYDINTYEVESEAVDETLGEPCVKGTGKMPLGVNRFFSLRETRRTP